MAATPTVFDLTWINARLNETDSSKRFFPLANSGGLRNFVTERPDPIMQNFDAGGQVFVRDSVRNNKFFVIGGAGSARYNGIINGFRCQQYGVYIIDRQQNVIGILSSSTDNCGTCNCNSSYSNTGLACSPAMADPYNLIWVPLYDSSGNRNGISLNSDDTAFLYPIPVDQESVYAKLVFNNAKDTVQGNMVNFDFAADFKDSTLDIIPCSSFTDWIPSMIRGLVDVCAEYVSIEQQDVVIKLVTQDGDAVNPTLAQGLTTIADWDFNDLTQSQTLTVASITESPSGTYAIHFSNLTVPDLGDEILLTITKNGYDFTCVSNSTFIIPLS